MNKLADKIRNNSKDASKYLRAFVADYDSKLPSNMSESLLAHDLLERMVHYRVLAKESTEEQRKVLLARADDFYTIAEALLEMAWRSAAE